MLLTKKKQKIIGEYKIHEKDTGSPEVQVALLTEQIEQLAKHLKKNPLAAEPQTDNAFPKAPRGAGTSHFEKNLRRAGQARQHSVNLATPPFPLMTRKYCLFQNHNILQCRQ